MDKPSVITTRKPLPFGELSPLEFERLTLWLVEREGYVRAQHLGETGSEQGRDVVAYRPTDGGEELWYFQCKRYNRMDAATLKKEVDKYNELAAAHPDRRPHGIVFVTNASVSAKVRDDVKAYCQRHGYAYDFWARNELDMRVKLHPDIVAEFFDAGRGLAPPAVSPALHQLPSPPRDFTGRESELDELTRNIGRGVHISGLHGMGGVGKTALALKLAERLAPQYPDAQFYLDLKGVSPQPLTPSDAMLHVIRSYDPTARPPDNDAETSARYRSVLHGQRALLLMDNAKDAAQVEPLIPPPSCLLLVTSRKHFTLPGLFDKDLDTLPEEDARALVLKIAPRIAEHADQIARLCGRLPIALRLAASALAERKDLSASDYARRLTDARKRLELVKASLTLSYDLLTPDLQKLWRTLAVFPDTFDAPAAATVWEMEQDAAQDALGELVKYSVLEWDEETTRYGLHDLARLFADARLDDEERAAGRMSHAAHYVIVLWDADTLYKEGGEALKRGLSLFDSEWRNIQAAQVWVEAQMDADDTTASASLCNEYCNAGSYLLSLRHHSREQIRWLNAGLSAARRLNYRHDEASHLTGLGIAHAYMGDARRAIEFYEQASEIFREIGDRESESRNLGNVGAAYFNLGDIRRAIEFHEQALVMAREIGDRAVEGNALGNLGNAHVILGEFRLAIKLYEQLLTIARQARDRRAEGHALINLGTAHERLGETGRAVEFHEQALAAAREVGDRRAEGIALNSLGVGNISLGELQRAVEFSEQALEISREVGDRRAEGNALGNLGNAYLHMGDKRRAIEYHEQRLDITRETGDRQAEGSVLGNLGNAHRLLGESRRAVEFLEQHLVIARDIGDRNGEAYALLNISLALNQLGDRAQAVARLEEALEIYEQIESPHASKVRAKLDEWRGEAEGG